MRNVIWCLGVIFGLSAGACNDSVSVGLLPSDSGQTGDPVAATAALRARGSGSPTLNLLRAINLPGSFLRDQQVWADRARVYAVSYQGSLFVLSRDPASGFSFLETLELGVVLSAVGGNDHTLYVLGEDGLVRIFDKGSPLRLTGTVSVGSLGLDSLALIGTRKVYVSEGQAEMEVDSKQVYISALNEGEVGRLIVQGNLTDIIYGQVFSFGVTMVYDRRTGETVGQIPNPGSGQVALADDKSRLFQTVPGCCGAGIWIYRKSDLTLERFISEPWANTVMTAQIPGKDLLFAGTEAGFVDLIDASTGAVVASADLPSLTGHTNPEDIEIRALWVDGLDNLIFAGSSWGNDISRGPDLPSFFVLEIR